MDQMYGLKVILFLSFFLFSIFSESEAKEFAPINCITSQINVDLDSLNCFNIDEFGFEHGFIEESKIGIRKMLQTLIGTVLIYTFIVIMIIQIKN